MLFHNEVGQIYEQHYRASTLLICHKFSKLRVHLWPCIITCNLSHPGPVHFKEHLNKFQRKPLLFGMEQKWIINQRKSGKFHLSVNSIGAEKCTPSSVFRGGPKNGRKKRGMSSFCLQPGAMDVNSHISTQDIHIGDHKLVGPAGVGPKSLATGF
jgi:hypothetical protein